MNYYAFGCCNYVNFNENANEEILYLETDFIMVLPFQQSTLQLEVTSISTNKTHLFIN